MMKRMFVALIIVFSCVCAAPAGGLTTDVEPTQLRCEYLENPLGIDVPRPRLSWKLEAADARGIRQTAYHVLVASSEKLLKEGKADLWDSGKVESEQSLNVEYPGKSLESLMRCFWKVKVWTAKSEAGGQSKEKETEVESSGWSNPAIWTTGVLKPGDLGAAKLDQVGS